ncbi:thioredoxin fold domain-containing protein [Uliginosibacterium sediminicola]|uniref:Thiol:disulfide interchange protein n=1 Tax=Uliginosibacterium sediminicola TaxID=2024550 RepID=A0ABU9YX09_9RHOO
MNSKLWRASLAAICMAGSMSMSVAADAASKSSQKARAETQQELEIRKSVEQVVTTPGAIDSVRKTSYGNFFEVVLSNGDIVYADPSGSFLISGPLVDIKSKKNVTAERTKELQQININDLPLANAIKQVRGNGKRILITFEDPNCVYCKKLAKDLVSLKDTTIYTFLTPILAPDSAEKSKAIWCSSDRAKAWNDWMTEGKTPSGSTACDNPIAKNMELQQRLRINGTPTMFLADGNRLGGYVPLAELDKSISEAGEKARSK